MKLEKKIEYHPDGKTIKSVYVINRKGQLHGLYENYDEQGQLFMKCSYEKGKKNGSYEAYSKNGQMFLKCTYKKDKIDGDYESYHENGNLFLKCTYKKGKKNGSYERYYDNGQLWKKCSYSNGEIDAGSYVDYLKESPADKGCCSKKEKISPTPRKKKKILV